MPRRISPGHTARMLGRVFSLVAALLLASANAQASAPARSIAHQGALASPAKTAPREIFAVDQPASGKNPLASVCRVGEKWHPPQNLTSGAALYDWAGGRVLRTRRTNLTSYAQHDALKSPTRWSRADGGELARATYDAWGNATQQSGTLPPIGYTGYYADAESSLYYAQQRYYSPKLGRFTRIDPWTGEVLNPITLNKYLYANGNPLYFIDTTGMYGEAGHYYTSYIVARELNLTHEQASTFALHSQYPDEVGALDAINQVAPAATRVFAKFAIDNFSVIPVQIVGRTIHAVQCGLHSLCGGRPEPSTKVARELLESSDSLESAGVAAHLLGDSFSHRKVDNESKKYKGWLGHLWDWTSPDEIHRRPELYREYVGTLAQSLAKQSGAEVSPERILEIQEKMMSSLESAKHENLKNMAEWDDRTRYATHDPMYQGPSMSELTTKHFARVAEEAADGRTLLRPERTGPGHFSHSGDEVDNLRTLYKEGGVEATEVELRQKAKRLESAVKDVLKRERDAVH